MKTVEAIDRRLDELQDEIAEIDAAQNPQPLQNLADAPVCQKCGRPTTLVRIDSRSDSSRFSCKNERCVLHGIVLRIVHRAFGQALRRGPLARPTPSV
ncbi:MAG: hypothetical protein ACYC35_28295 [Pirellulales bacterium]